MRYAADDGELSRTEARFAFGSTGGGAGYQPQAFGAVALTLPQQWKADGQVSPTGDARLAAVFRQIRAILGLDEVAMARRLGTGIDVVLGLETGSVDTLPSWPETARVVERYAELGGVDPAPILGRLLHLQTIPIVPPPRLPTQPAALRYGPLNDEPVNGLAEALRQQPQMERSPEPPPSAYRARPTTIELHAETIQTEVAARDRTGLSRPPSARDEPVVDETSAAPIGFAARTRLQGEATTERTRPPAIAETEADQTVAAARRRRRARNTGLVLSPLAILVVLLICIYAAPRASYAVANSLPGPFGSATRGLVDIMVAQAATVKDGLRWIAVSDPRIRKASRLDMR